MLDALTEGATACDLSAAAVTSQLGWGRGGGDCLEELLAANPIGGFEHKFLTKAKIWRPLMQASDVMTATVISVKPEMSVRDAARVLAEHRISGAPVVDARGRVVGMISEGDLLHRTELGTLTEGRRSWWLDLISADHDAANYIKAHGRTVQDVMTAEVTSIGEATSLSDVATVLESRHVKRVPVLRDGQLVGIVSRANLVQALASITDEPGGDASPSDRDIRAMLMGELAGHKWAFAGRNIVVRDGVVHLWGSSWSTDSLRAMCVAAESIPGVKRVEDHTEPYQMMPGV
jgi:CBS domain-containing protein